MSVSAPRNVNVAHASRPTAVAIVPSLKLPSVESRRDPRRVSSSAAAGRTARRERKLVGPAQLPRLGHVNDLRRRVLVGDQRHRRARRALHESWTVWAKHRPGDRLGRGRRNAGSADPRCSQIPRLLRPSTASTDSTDRVDRRKVERRSCRPWGGLQRRFGRQTAPCRGKGSEGRERTISGGLHRAKK